MCNVTLGTFTDTCVPQFLQLLNVHSNETYLMTMVRKWKGFVLIYNYLINYNSVWYMLGAIVYLNLTSSFYASYVVC